jgi:hypothetical protein
MPCLKDVLEPGCVHDYMVMLPSVNGCRRRIGYWALCIRPISVKSVCVFQRFLKDTAMLSTSEACGRSITLASDHSSGNDGHSMSNRGAYRDLSLLIEAVQDLGSDGDPHSVIMSSLQGKATHPTIIIQYYY